MIASSSLALPGALLALLGAAVPSLAHESSRADAPPIATLAPPDDGRWSRFVSAEPTPRYSHAAIYDPVRDRMIVIGGWDESARNDVWALSLGEAPAWTQIVPSGEPPEGRFYFSAIYDALGDRVVLFGGVDGAGGNYLDDVWSLTIGDEPAWEEIDLTGPRPPARAEHSAVYDSARRRMIVFGGFSGGRWNDTWVLDLQDGGGWTELHVGGTPAGRSGHSAIFDAANDRMVVFGGAKSGQSITNDTWILSLGKMPSWAQPPPSGAVPYPRRDHTAVLDESGARMLVFAGINGRDDTWALDLKSIDWTILPAEGDRPAQRSRHVAIYDPQRARMIVHGGRSPLAADDVWTLDADDTPAWVKLDPFPRRATQRRWMPAVYDDIGNRMILFGGFRTVRYLGDVWAFSLGATPGWTEFAASPPHPPARSKHAAAFDALRGRMIVFGGWNGEVLDDLWALEIGDAPTWIHLDPPDPRPPPRYNATAIYDPVGDRVIVFGGLVEDPFQLFDDVWALELSGTPVWRELKPAGAGPAARMQHSAIYDSTGHRMIVFGGQAGQRQNDVWALDLEGEGAWSRVTTGGTPPSQRYGHSAVCDIARNRMIVFGGSTSQQIVGDLWSLDLGPNPTWSELDPMGSPPPPSRDHAAIYDPIRQRMAVFGGYPEGEELWFLEWSPLTAIDTPQPPETREGVSMPPPFPNPSRKGFTIRFSLPAAGAARVDVVDLAGRRVVRLADGRFSSGHHEIQWAGSDSRGIRVGAGVYFVTLRANDGVITRRITIF